ncbi:hypothetical protein [Hydrogenophaga sp.]|uniref:hypothetical protein n=1 Tax=Hydrogenophaga sp. TaxID=1904254 RepID=UPI0026032CA7|nr:hypothetical protein [Hydrogenophaga sp.]MCW5652288.1 hypothetical protein [Hydrogenophaga sp.]
MWPGALAAALCALVALSAWRAQRMGGWLMALLPVASLAPSTGWWLVNEFDLLVLAVLAGGYARWYAEQSAWRVPPPWPAGEAPAQTGRGDLWLRVALAGGALIGLVVGWRDAGVGPGSLASAWRQGDLVPQALYADYGSALNPLRVSLSLLWALLLVPLWLRGPARWQRQQAHQLVIGMAAGLALVCLLVSWERFRYVGLFNFSDAYRTVAAFWEMHVGGGAIDAYLALTVPLAFWAVWLAPTGWRWWGAAALAVWSSYTVLTTYSRGLYLAVAIALLAMAALAWHFRIRPALGVRRRAWALGVLVLALAAESVWVLGGQSFMSNRLAKSESDLTARVDHWRAGLSLLRSPSDILLGLGAGRLPAHYSARVPGGEFPGTVRWTREPDGGGQVTLYAPRTRQDLAYEFGLTQRVDLERQGSYRLRLRLETDAPMVLLASVCERHLLYEFRCQWKHVRLAEPVHDPDMWQEIELSGQRFTPAGAAVSWREGMFGLSALSAGGAARLRAVELIDPQGRQVLRNSEFADGLRHWFPVAQGAFKPWHMDNLYLEVLVERGVLGVLLFGTLAGLAVQGALRGLRRREPLALALAGSLVAMGALGMLISVTEMPRIALLLWLVLLTTSRLGRLSPCPPPVTGCNQGMPAVSSTEEPGRERSET